MKKFSLFIVTLLLAIPLFSQTAIRGTVKDTDGNPIPSATVMIRGTVVGTTTDLEGHYSISVNSDNTTLLFTCIGYDDVMENVSGRSTIDVTMAESRNLLDETVVIGYGSMTKKDLTGSVGVIKTEELSNKVMLSVDDALEGGVAGLMVSSASGRPGSASTMLIRGTSSLSGSTSPLIVLDGFPLFSVSTSSGGGITDVGLSSLSMVNTDDIESIQVLKDASATAIYGNRGANGVIIITTKKGKVGQNQGRIQYNGYVGFQNVTRQYKMMDVEQYAEYQAECNKSNSLFYDKGTLTPRNVSGIESHNWQDEVFRTGFLQTHSLSISHSSKKTNFIISGSFQHNNSVLICTDYKKLNAKAAVDHYFTDKVRMGLDINYSRVMDSGVPTGGEGTAQVAGVITSALIYQPFDIADENTQAMFRKAGISQVTLDNAIGNNHGNPVTQAQDTQMDKVINRTILNSYLECDIIQDLQLRITAGYDVYSLKDRQFYPTTTGRGYFYGGQGILGNSESTCWINENTLTYRPTFGKHRINAVVGVTEQGNTNYWDLSNSTQYQYEGLGYNNAGMATVFEIGSSKGRVHFLSFLGRVNYSYDNRYIATFTARRDGTSRFVKRKWGNFFSGALAWNIDSEPWMRQQDVASTLKLRLSLGQVGNSNVSTSGSYAQLGNNIYSFSDIPAIGQSPASIANEDLTWETTTEVNCGLEMGFLNDRITVNVDLYNKITDNLLLEAPVLNLSGFEKAWQNIGKLRNRGLEISMDTVILQNKDYQWSFNANFSTNKTTLLDLGNGGAPIYIPITCVGGNAIILEEGGDVGNIYGYRTIGVYGLGEFDKTGKIAKDGVAIETGAERPGAMKFADLNNDKKITSDDREVIGNTMPDFYGSFGTEFRYKNLTLNLGFQYMYGADVYNANYKVLAKYNSESYNQMAFYADRWSENNLESTMYNQMTPDQICSAFVEDASYLRFKTLRLTCNFPKKWFNARTHIEALRVYACCENLYVFTRYSGYGPEVSNSTNVFRAGFDYGCFPRPRTYTFGINLSFK